MCCVVCGEAICIGDTYYEINGDSVCIDHVLDYLEDNCKEFGDDGEEIYVVGGMGYDIDDVATILKSCEKICNEESDDDWGNPADEPECRDEWNER